MSRKTELLTTAQKRLADLNYYTVEVDGIEGPATNAAITEFKRNNHLRPRPLVGPLTLARLMSDKAIAAPAFEPPVVEGHAEAPPWLVKAYGYLGLKEIPGRNHNDKIVDWWEALGLHFRDDETPWCAGFANRMVQMAGYPIPAKYRAAALGWRWTGHGVKLRGPALGAIMTMTRPGRAGSGHKTFVAGRDRQGRIMGLGGNQGNAVSINPYHPTARDAQYHFPPGYPPPSAFGVNALPLISSAGKPLTNEA
ncbi:MAG: TIGR02594 family protein [Pseudomonadota bacterium]